MFFNVNLGVAHVYTLQTFVQVASAAGKYFLKIFRDGRPV